MKDKSSILIILLLGIIISGMVYLWISQPKIVYVKSDYLLEKYGGMVDARADYQVKASSWQGNLDTLKSTLEFAIKEYELKKDNMSKKDREEKEKFIRAKQKDLMTYSQAIEQKAKEEDQKSTTEVINNMNNFLKEYGEKKGYSIIFGANGSGGIVYAKDAIDITEEVLVELNKWYEGDE